MCAKRAEQEPTMYFSPFKFTCALVTTAALSLALSACGGGGGGGGGADNSKVPSVSSASAATPVSGQPLLFTFNGSNLDQGIGASSPGCKTVTLNTTAPNVSTATTAYFVCELGTVGAQTLTVTRNSDAVQLFSVAFNVPAPPSLLATVTSASAATPLYGQNLLITVNGSNLDKGITGTSTGCKNVTLSTTAPNISTATTAYLQCTVSAVGASAVNITRNSDTAAIGSAPFTVPVPQVTFVMSNGGAVNGSLVITLEPAKAPITVDNFLAYVKSGFYNGTIIHRNVTNFVLQGGGYAGPLAISNTAPTLKTTNAPIVLEDDKGLLNLQNTLSMARTNLPDSGTSQFFINLKNNTNLDRAGSNRGYAVFGTITSGADLVTSMAAAPCSPWAAAGGSECFPVPNITLTSATQTR
jgi:cyclophilin family peptidyl-prolyl cis-trans isomerase